MNPSTAWKARRPMASNPSAVPSGARARSVSTARSESRRKKKTSSSASTAMAMPSPTTLTPLITPEAAVPPNFVSNSRALEAMSSSEVPAAPKCSVSPRAASFSEATISSPLFTSAATTMYTAPPTTATTATQVTPAATDRLTRALTSRRWNGPSNAVPSNASNTGTTAVRNSTHSRIPTYTTPDTSRITTHQAARRRTGAGSSDGTPPADHALHGLSCADDRPGETPSSGGPLSRIDASVPLGNEHLRQPPEPPRHMPSVRDGGDARCTSRTTRRPTRRRHSGTRSTSTTSCSRRQVRGCEG